MRDPILLLEDLKNISSTNEKIAFIQKHKDNKEFMQLLKIVIDTPLNIRSLDYERKTKDEPIKHKASEFISLANYLANNSRSHATIDEAIKFLQSCSKKEQELYEAIITQTFRLGIKAKLVNKALGYKFIETTNLMKAEAYQGQELAFPIAVEEKLDGVRLAAFVRDGQIEFRTYNNKVVYPQTLKTALLKFINKFGLDNVLIDGEALASIRTKTSGIIRKLMFKRPDIVDTDLTYHIFDIIPIADYDKGICKTTYKERRQMLDSISHKNTSKKITIVQAYIINSSEKLYEAFYATKAEGKEGLMLKLLNGLYEAKRSKFWLKMKAVYSASLKVIDFEYGIKGTKYENQIGALVCQTSDGEIIKVGSGLPDDVRALPFEKLKGKIIEVNFTDVSVDSEGKPFIDFPRFKEFRVDKEEADSFGKILTETGRNLL